MAGRKRSDTEPRKKVVRQVCMTHETAEMLDRVAEAQYEGRVSHALLGLISPPLLKAYKQLES